MIMRCVLQIEMVIIFLLQFRGQRNRDLSQSRVSALLDEAKHALVELSQDPKAEHAFRDWTDRAALLWMVTTACSKALGNGSDTDVRAARRVLARHAPVGLLRKDRATVDDVRAVAFR